MTSATLLQVCLFLVLGFGAGAVHWIGLRQNVAAYLEGGRLGPALGLHIGRFILTIAVLAVAAQFGAPTILAALAGFLVSRYVVTAGPRTPTSEQGE
jgi:N-ATPase, AtpR subunit